jgi:hypothetical protein
MRYIERHLLRLLTQNNPNSDLIPEEPDGMVDEEDIPILDSWTEQTVDDLWVLGDDVEYLVPIGLEFAPWHQETLINDSGTKPQGYHR